MINDNMIKENMKNDKAVYDNTINDNILNDNTVNNHIKNAKVFKAFCDENRLQILELLQGGEKCACVLLEKLNIGQSTLSHHMKILIQSGIVNARNEGKWTYYSISLQGSQNAIDLLSKLTAVSNNDTKICQCKE